MKIQNPKKIAIGTSHDRRVPKKLLSIRPEYLTSFSSISCEISGSTLTVLKSVFDAEPSSEPRIRP